MGEALSPECSALPSHLGMAAPESGLQIVHPALHLGHEGPPPRQVLRPHLLKGLTMPLSQMKHPGFEIVYEAQAVHPGYLGQVGLRLFRLRPQLMHRGLQGLGVSGQLLAQMPAIPAPASDLLAKPGHVFGQITHMGLL